MGRRGRRMGVVALLLGSVLAPGATARAERRPQSPPADAPITSQAVEFTVTNPADGGRYQLAGVRYDPACVASTVVLLIHGLSYTKEVWDVPGYSVAQPFAHAGYSVVILDRLGYGASPLPDGRRVTALAYADMTGQVVDQLHKDQGGFMQVVLGGHGTGAEVAELEAGLTGGVAAVMALGYTHSPSKELLTDLVSGDVPRSTAADYEYFLGTPSHRSEMFYSGDADPAVVAADAAGAVKSPSGEIQSAPAQPSGRVLGRITVPVYLQLGQQDRLFPPEFLPAEGASFRSSPHVVTDIVPGAGHTLMLHPIGNESTFHLVSWVRNLPLTPPCS
jgi:pimeloyl-ACP methyl ester carboxylesterase